MPIVGSLIATALAACDDTKSYAELLDDEDVYVNNFLANQTVELVAPDNAEDFLTGPDAPYYRIDEDGMLYMQVLNAGTPGGQMVEDNEQVYFRYTRYALSGYTSTLGDDGVYAGTLPVGEGNNTALNPCWFRYNNYQIASSYTWGVGVQAPLKYFPVDCEINIVIKSQMGPTDEMADVVPYLWRLTYSPRQ